MFVPSEEQIEEAFRHCYRERLRWRWYQLRLSTLFSITTVAALLLGYWKLWDDQHPQEQIVRRLGGVASGVSGSRGLMGLLELTPRTVYWADFSGTAITDDDLAALQSLSDLSSLDLSNTRITGQGLERLRRLEPVRYVDLSGTRVTQAAIDKLSAERPELTFGPIKESSRLFW